MPHTLMLLERYVNAVLVYEYSRNDPENPSDTYSDSDAGKNSQHCHIGSRQFENVDKDKSGARANH
jgi:hypothetical protein